MRNFTSLWRLLAMDAIVIAICVLFFEGIDPYADRATMARFARLILAVALAVGILPGSYLDAMLKRTSLSARISASWLVVTVALGLPGLGLILFAMIAYDYLVILKEAPGVVFASLISLLQVLFLIINGATLRRILRP